MKTKVVVAVLLLMGSLTVKVSAQETLKALVKKCENMDSVSMTIVRDRDKETKQWKRSVITLNIRNNAALVNEFIEAFRKDEAVALKVIENKDQGRSTNFFYSFEGVNYSLRIKDKANASISVFEGENDPLPRRDRRDENISGNRVREPRPLPLKP
ncbi:MAG: DUF5024 domain-containing protein [Tannerellaceae bacterium]|jgi:hypothetical protein|nr:DUF5024 domain-containing protein [Tannerellaceae bacterium]